VVVFEVCDTLDAIVAAPSANYEEEAKIMNGWVGWGGVGWGGVEWGGVEWSEERNNGMMVRLSEHPSNSYSPHVERSDFSTDDCL